MPTPTPTPTPRLPANAAALRAACKLSLCYNDARLDALLASATTSADGVLATLGQLPYHDAVRVVAGCLATADAVFWAERCAARARGYAAAAAAAAAADAARAARAAAYAAYAAAAAYAAYAADAAAGAYAADAADAAAQRAAERKTALLEGCRLLGWVV